MEVHDNAMKFILTICDGSSGINEDKYCNSKVKNMYESRMLRCYRVTGIGAGARRELLKASKMIGSRPSLLTWPRYTYNLCIFLYT